MKKNFNINNHLGMSMIEVMVAGALLAIIGVGVGTVINNTTRAQRGMQAKDMQRDVMADIRTLLSNKQACINTMGGQVVTGAGFSLTDIRDGATAPGAVRYTTTTGSAQNLDRSGLIQFNAFTVNNYVDDPGLTNQGRALFNVRLNKTGNFLGARELFESVALHVKRNGAGAITECFTYGTLSDGLWQVSPVNNSNIYYGAGRVGVGTSSPVATLDVAGSVSAGAGASGGYGFPGGGSGDFGSITYELLSGAENMGLRFQVGNDPQDEIQLRASGPIKFFTNATQRMIINSTGDVGIGAANPARKLHVARTDGVGGVVLQLEVTPVNTVYQQYTTPGFDFFTGMRANGDFALEDVFNGTTPRIFIQRSTGRVGIGTTAPESTLHVNGAVQASVYHWTSDANLKNIISKSKGLSAITQLNGYKFSWKEDGKKDYGVIAQEVEKVFPELVINGSEYKSVNYMGLIAPLIESVKELDAQQKILTRKMKNLESVLEQKRKNKKVHQ